MAWRRKVRGFQGNPSKMSSLRYLNFIILQVFLSICYELENGTKYLVEFTCEDDEGNEILRDKPKELVALNKLIEEFEKNEPKINQQVINSGKDLSGVKIPKMNPLMNMNKNYNKFDMVPGNIFIPMGNSEYNKFDEKFIIDEKK